MTSITTHRAVDADQIAQAMIDKKMIWRKPNGSVDGDVGNFASIMGVPVFDPSPEGKWILNEEGYNSCSVCGHEIPSLVHVKFTVNGTFNTKTSIDPTNFCPFCGAKMEVANEVD